MYSHPTLDEQTKYFIFFIETNFKLNIKFKILINVKYILSVLLSRNVNVPILKNLAVNNNNNRFCTFCDRHHRIPMCILDVEHNFN